MYMDQWDLQFKQNLTNVPYCDIVDLNRATCEFRTLCHCVTRSVSKSLLDMNSWLFPRNWRSLFHLSVLWIGEAQRSSKQASDIRNFLIFTLRPLATITRSEPFRLRTGATELILRVCAAVGWNTGLNHKQVALNTAILPHPNFPLISRCT